MEQEPVVSAAVARPLVPRGDLLLAMFLARYSGGTRVVYATRIRQWFGWCEEHGLDPVRDVTRPHIELYGRWCEEIRGNSPSTVHGNLCTLRIFYRLLALDGVIPHSPAENVRMPKVFTDEVKIQGLNRDELSRFLACAREMSADHSALAVLLGLLGLRVSEACAVQIDDFQDYEGDHRVLRLVGKGKKPATIPLPPAVSRELDRCAEGRTGQLLRRVDGVSALDRGVADRMVKTIAKRAGIRKRLSPHSLRHSFVTNALDAGVPLRDVQIAARHSDPRVTTRYDRNRGSLDRHAVHRLTAYIVDE